MSACAKSRRDARDERTRAVARRRRPPGGPGDVRRPRHAARRRQRDPAARAGGRPGRRLGGNGFRRAGQPRGRWTGASPADLSVGADALGVGAACDGSFGIRRPRFRDGLRVARDAAAGDGLRPPRRRARPGGARPRAARRGTGQGVRQRPRSAGVAAGPGSRRGQLWRRERRHPDALRIRLDGNGFPAAVDDRRSVRPRVGGAPTRWCGSACCRRGCASTPASAPSTAAAATPPSSCVRTAS